MMIPLVGYIIIKNHKSVKTTIIWFAPVVIIPMIWPLSTFLAGNFDEWLDGVLFQSSRESSKDLRYSVGIITEIDPVFFVISVAGFIYSQIRADYFILLWIVPLMIFFLVLGWVVHFHWILFLPPFCIMSAILVETVYTRIKTTKLARVSVMALISGIVIFGLISTTNQIISNLNASYFELYAYISREIYATTQDDRENGTNSVSIIGPHRTRVLLWIPMYVNNNSNVQFIDTDIPTQVRIDQVTTSNILIIVDNNLRNRLIPYEDVGNEKDRQLSWLYHNANTKATFVNKESNVWNYMTISENYGLGSFVEVKANY